MFHKIKNIDPRYLFLLFFLGVFVDTFCFKVYMKTYTQLIFSLIGALGSDIVINYIRHRKLIFPVSGLVSSCGTFILISSPFNWPFLVLGFLSIYSKHFITFNGKHIFNPVNFGSALTIFYLSDYVQSGASAWSGQYFMIPYLATLGLMLVWKARSIFICFSYLVSFLAIHFLFLKDHLPVNIASFAAPPFFLFVFFMISDPGTTPRKFFPQIVFGLCVAAVEAVFKFNRILNGGLWSLLIVCFVFTCILPSLKSVFLKPRLAGIES